MSTISFLGVCGWALYLHKYNLIDNNKKAIVKFSAHVIIICPRMYTLLYGTAAACPSCPGRQLAYIRI
jgi:hypothetical protein